MQSDPILIRLKTYFTFRAFEITVPRAEKSTANNPRISSEGSHRDDADPVSSKENNYATHSNVFIVFAWQREAGNSCCKVDIVEYEHVDIHPKTCLIATEADDENTTNYKSAYKDYLHNRDNSTSSVESYVHYVANQNDPVKDKYGSIILIPTFDDCREANNKDSFFSRKKPNNVGSQIDHTIDME